MNKVRLLTLGTSLFLQILAQPSWGTAWNALTPPDAALYSGPGVWDTGHEHLSMFLKEHGHSFVTLSPEDILNGKLRSLGNKVLIMPGGESWKYLESLSTKGADEIKSFVANGGSYIGICAGSFYATSHREGGYATGPYGIGLLDGTAYDGTALGVKPFIEGMMDFDFSLMDFKSLFRIVLFGGPSFHYSDEEARQKQIEVLARFQKIHEPAMIRFHYKKGRVFLSAPHLEIEEDRTDWGKKFKDPESDWPILEANYQWLIQN